MVTNSNFPIQPTILIANLVFSGVLSFILVMMEQFANISMLMLVMILPALVIWVTIYCQYCFDVAHDSAMGREETPVYRFKGFDLKAASFSVICLSASYLAIGQFDTLLASIILALFLPPLMCSLIVEQHFFKAINPINWFSYIAQLKQYYALPVASLMIIYNLSPLLQSDYWLWPKLFVFMLIILWNYYFIGDVLFRRRKQIKMYTPETRQERESRLEKQANEDAYEKHSDLWHKLCNVREFTKAVKLVEDYVISQPEPLKAVERVMKDLCSWRNTRLAAKYLPQYLSHILPHNKFGIAHARVRQLLTEHPDITEILQPHSQALITFAREIDDHEIADMLENKPNNSINAF